MNSFTILVTKPQADYELLDSGEGEKLERYGRIILSRPDPQALWRKNLPAGEWAKAAGVFLRDGKSTEWKIKPGTPEKWPIELGGLKFWIRPTAFKHTGLFPEQLSNWEWVRSICHSRESGNLGKKSADPRWRGDDSKSGDKIRVLNLFGYTGGATLAAARAGAAVCHLDGSKVAIGWARANAELSGLKDKPVRWILDDATAFVRREIKRGRRYDGIIMDPPAFGHGPAGETWKIEEHFLPLLDLCFQVLAEQPLFFLVNGYASGYSSIAYENNLAPLVKNYGGAIAKGELAIAERSGRLLPAGIFARWRSCPSEVA